MIKRVLLGLLIFGLLPVVSAEISISQLNNEYSLGDTLNSQIDLLANQQTNGFLIAKLSCANSEVELYRSSYNLAQGQSVVVPISLLLTKSLIEDARGACQIIVSYGNEVVSSQNFQIYDGINVEAIVGNTNYGPGQSIQIDGTAFKMNGQAVDGFVEARLPNNGTIVSVVSSGNFRLNFTLPENARAGDYSIRVFVYDKDPQGEINNAGEISKSVQVRQIVRTVEVSSDKENIVPENDLGYLVKVLDQSGQAFEKDVEIVLYDPKGNVVLRKNIRSNVQDNLEIKSSFSYGYWKLETNIEGVRSTKLFYVEEYEKADFELDNESLFITNVGNVDYVKDVEVTIGEEIRTISVDLKPGQTKEFRLKAPENFYDIFINDGLNSIQGSAFLTGRAIDVSETGGILDFRVVIFVILLIFVSSTVYIVGRKKAAKLFSMAKISKKASKGISMAGKREQAVSLAIRHTSPDTDEAKAALQKMIDSAMSQNAIFQKDANHSVFTLSPGVTKKQENEENAVKLASKISEILNDHNSKYKNKIEFGIGVNDGEAILENKSGSIGITSIGSLVSGAKKIAGMSKGDVLLSDNVHRRVIKTIKTEKISDDAWKVTKITDRSNVDLDRLLKRS